NAQQTKQQDNQAIPLLENELAGKGSINTDPGAVIASPNDPNGQSSPRPKLDIVAGAFLGLIVGVGWSLVDDRLDDSLRGRVDLAQNGKRVVLVSADMRRPRLHEFFGLENDRGLAEILSHKMPAWEGLQESGVENLWIFTSGQVADAPAELLSSDRMIDFISERREVVYFIVIDSPSLLAVSDGIELEARVVCVFYVADAEHT